MSATTLNIQPEIVDTRGKRCVKVCFGTGKIGLPSEQAARTYVQATASAARRAGVPVLEAPTRTTTRGQDCWQVCLVYPPKGMAKVKINWPWGQETIRPDASKTLAAPRGPSFARPRSRSFFRQRMLRR